MENKKQLVIVPPMSEPLQKLNEVLQGIATDENIDIMIVDDPKELNQFIGSAGQSLTAFSSAKKCATFLQENRFVIAKTHSKVILLTAKEIPAKTLAKFVKLGLTESILESSPPKTLLYKVKLLLRSIKSVAPQEDKDQVVKSMLDLNSTNVKLEERTVERLLNDDDSENSTDEDQAKFKTEIDENAVNIGENLKGKTTIQEDAIETHWKSKRKRHDTLEDESGNQKVEDEDSSAIDMYYRGKKEKKKYDDLIDTEEDLYGKKVPRTEGAYNEEEEDQSSNKKRTPETILNLEAARPKTRKNDQGDEDEANLYLKPSKEGQLIEATDDQIKPKKAETEEEKVENRKKEFEELEALFADAKKRQEKNLSIDLGGHLKGKILNNQNDEEFYDDIEKEKKEYDNSDLYERKKNVKLELTASREDKKKSGNNEEEKDNEKAPTKNQLESIDNNMVGKDGSPDKLTTNMMSDFSEDGSKKITQTEVYDFDLTKKRKGEDVELTNERKKKLNLVEDAESDLTGEEEQTDLEYETENGKAKTKSITIELLQVEKTKKATGAEDLEDQDYRRRRAKLDQLESDNDKDRSKSESEEADAHMAVRKINQTDLDLDKSKGARENHGKVDKIDTFYRGKEKEKTEFSWDLNKENRDINLQLKKNKRSEDEILLLRAAKDNGEITIDYRKLKEEFEQISRGGQSYGKGPDGLSQNLLDSEDEGTFKVIELDACGFDFGINIINLIDQKDSKSPDFYKMIAEELITKYKAYSVFYTYKTNDKKHIESFDSFMHFSTTLISNELKEWWLDTKSEEEKMASYFSKSITTWLCREIEDKSGNTGKFWEDAELPQWAANELTNKKVELIFPYFDGVDRMGVAVVFFPEGINPKMEKGLSVTLEMARTILLDSIQREASSGDKSDEDDSGEKKNILNMFTGFFNRSKAG